MDNIINLKDFKIKNTDDVEVVLNALFEQTTQLNNGVKSMWNIIKATALKVCELEKKINEQAKM